jgi:hypothetical protein
VWYDMDKLSVSTGNCTASVYLANRYQMYHVQYIQPDGHSEFFQFFIGGVGREGGVLTVRLFIHSFHRLSYGRSIDSSKASSSQIS